LCAYTKPGSRGKRPAKGDNENNDKVEAKHSTSVEESEEGNKTDEKGIELKERS